MSRFIAILVLCGTLLAVVPGPSIAQATDAAGLRSNDEDVRRLKQEILTAALAELPDPAAARDDDKSLLKTYASLRGGGPWQFEVVLSVDGGTPMTIAYDDRRALALRKSGGLDLQSVLQLEPGQHSIHARLEAHRLQPRDDSAPVVDDVTQAVVLHTGTAAIEIAIRYPRAGAAPFVSMVQLEDRKPDAVFAGEALKITRFETASPSDPNLRHAEFLRESADPLEAIVLLTRYGRAAGDLAAGNLVFRSLLAQCRIAYGLPPEAAGLDASAGTFIEDRDDLDVPARLAFAGYELDRGEPEQALARLPDLPSKLFGNQKIPVDSLHARILLAAGRYDEAVAVLARLQVDPVKLLTMEDDEALQALVLQYNFGIALMQSGKTEQGRGVLDRLGQFPARNDLSRSLRDKANLALGWSFLRERQGSTARPVLERVSLSGPYSNRALLALGWAEIATQGSKQHATDVAADTGQRDTPRFILKMMLQRKLIDCEEFNRRALAPPNDCSERKKFDLGDAPADEHELTRRALVPWLELLQRDPDDPAVIEARSAIPFALDHLGDHEQAGRYYQAAISGFEQTTASLDADLQDVARNGLVRDVDASGAGSSPMTPTDIALLLAAHHLEPLLDSPSFLRISNHRNDMIGLHAWIGRQSSPRLLALQSSVAAAGGRQDLLLRDLAVATLSRQMDSIRSYETAARLGLSRIYDPAPSGAAVE